MLWFGFDSLKTPGWKLVKILLLWFGEAAQWGVFAPDPRHSNHSGGSDHHVVLRPASWAVTGVIPT